MSSMVHLEFPSQTPEKLLRNFLDKTTLSALESLSEVVTPEKVVLITASRDVDLKNFHFIKTKNVYNESFWERGVHLSYEFSLKADCKDNRFCQYMSRNYDKDYRYSLYGELSQKESLELFGKPPVSETRKNPENFQPLSIKLEFPLSFTESLNDDSFINFALIGDFALPIEQNKTLHFSSELSFQPSAILLTGSSSSIWSSALELNPLNLSQISLKGRLSLDTYLIKNLEIGSLAVFGRDCFLMTSDESLFQKSRCFYGNADLTADYKEFKNNFLEGYFPNANIWNILFTGLDYETFRQYEVISKHISNIKLINGVDLIFAMREILIETRRYKNHTEMIESRVIPKGFSIKGLANVIGLDGVLLMNIKPIEKEITAVFSLNSAVSFAGGNAIVLQTDLNSKDTENSVVFYVRNSEIPQEKQVNFLGKVNLFNVQMTINMSITNEFFLLKTKGMIFQGLYSFELELKAPYSDSLKTAAFRIKGLFSEELLIDLENSLRNRTVDWMNYVKNILEKLDLKIKELKNLMEFKQNELCNEDLCPKALQCVEEPHQQCLEYPQRTLCKKQESFCLKPEQICEKEQKVCVGEVKTCVNFDSITQECKENKTECVDFLTICTQWKHVCNAETVIACSEFEVKTDESLCKRMEFACKIEEIKDVICQNDCQLRRKQYEKYEKLYEDLQMAKEMFNRKLTGFWIMNDEISKKNRKFISVLAGKFEENCDSLIDPRALVMEVSVVSFKEDLMNEENLEVIEERDFDFRDLDNFSKRIFGKLAKKWSMRFAFDEILLKENEADLLNSLFMKVDQNFTTAFVGNLME